MCGRLLNSSTAKVQLAQINNLETSIRQVCFFLEGSNMSFRSLNRSRYSRARALQSLPETLVVPSSRKSQVAAARAGQRGPRPVSRGVPGDPQALAARGLLHAVRRASNNQY